MKNKVSYPSVIEIWITVYIDGLKTMYQVSNNGRVRNGKTLKILSQRIDRYGYPQVCLCYGKGHHTRTVHRLVASAFIPNPLNKPQVNHIDGCKTHNYTSNLEWSTEKENIIHSYKNGLHDNIAIGENHGNNVYEECRIHNVCKLLEENTKTYSEISKLTGVPIATIHDILGKRYWRHISMEYNIDNYSIRKRKPVDNTMKKKIVKYAREGKSVHEIRILLKLPYTDNGNAVIAYYVKKYKNTK